MTKGTKIFLWVVGGILGLILILFVVLYLSTMGDYSVTPTVEADSSLPHIEINGRLFHAESFGNDTNEVVIVIHGGPGNDYLYLLPLKPLEDKYRVVFYDQRGAGLSQRVDASEQSLEISLLDLDGIINYYSSDRKVNIIGHSWGAMLASAYLAKNPQKINRIVLAEPGMLTSEKALEYFESFNVEFTFKTISEIARVVFESLHVDNSDGHSRQDYLFAEIGQLDVPGNPMRKYFCDENIHSAHLPYWRYGAIAGQEIVNKAINDQGRVIIDLVSGVENYKEKVLFISGACNELIGPAFQEDHMRYFPNAEMVIIEDAGHSMFGEKPDECLEVIREYFNSEDSQEQ